MRVIFLDLDGVLNCEQTFLDYFYKKENNLLLSMYYQIHEKGKNGFPLPIDEEKVQILGEIVRLTDAKIVLSSSHRADWKDGKEKLQFSKSKALLYLFDKYNIDVIDITPYIGNSLVSHREDEIKAYLNLHKEIESFCILDDDDFDLQSLKDFLVKTTMNKNEFDEGGLQKRHINEAVKILCKKRI